MLHPEDRPAETITQLGYAYADHEQDCRCPVHYLLDCLNEIRSETWDYRQGSHSAKQSMDWLAGRFGMRMPADTEQPSK